MKITFTKVIVFFFLTINVFAQQGKYVRKSVSSLKSVWIKPGALENVNNVQMDIFNNFMKFYVEVPRFDFNVLPQNQIDEFLRQANALSDVNTEKLSEVMENTVVQDILKILNDPEVKENRGDKLKSEADLQTFAATKAKSLGLTTEQLETLMNSAYIYLPYVTKFASERDGSNLKLKIEGGIIWWQVVVKSDGEVRIEKVLDATTSGENEIDLEAKNILTGKKRNYDEYSFGDFTVKTTPEMYVQGDAMLTFAKNLGVKTKELDDFKLQAQIAEKIGNNYSFNLGLSEGVHLDDGFFLIELTEDENGNEKKVDMGFIRITNTGKNIDDPLALSSAIQMYGEEGGVGSLVMEYPRLGMDIRARFGLKTGMNIPAEYTNIPGFYQILKSDATSAMMMDVDFSYNLAPIINSSQTFLDIGFSIGLPLAKYSTEAVSDGVVALVWDIGLGASKKFWRGRTNVPVAIMFNFQSFSMGSEDIQYNISSFGFSLTSGVEYMLKADIVLNVGLEMNLTTKPGRVSLTYDGEEIYSITDPDAVAELYPDLYLGGWTFKIGIDYALRQLPFNIFGFLDPMKKY